MTESEAREWIRNRFGEASICKLDRFANIVRNEAVQQNLVGPNTIDTIWHRHIVDSAQLIRFASPRAGTRWVDIGSGAGFPGIVVALLSAYDVVLVEPRVLRAAFLQAVSIEFDNAFSVASMKAGRLPSEPKAAIISARAVAPLPRLIDQAIHFATTGTTWVLPKGKSFANEIEAARKDWQGVFHVEPSVTDRDAGIIVATELSRR